MSIRLAYDMRRTLQDEYWATLPPDTLTNYLAIARNLRLTTVPEEYDEGRLPPLHVVKAATLQTDRVEVVQTDDHQVWLVGCAGYLRRPTLFFAYIKYNPHPKKP